jgi:hypothetical protein
MDAIWPEVPTHPASSGALGTPWGLPVPAPGPGTCVRCHGPTRPGRPECYCCSVVGAALGEGAGSGSPVVALRLCRPGDPLHGALRRYKDAPAASSRRHYRAVLASLLRGFVLRHGACLRELGGGWQALAVVPSSRRGAPGGPGVRPFEAVAGAVPELAVLPRLRLRRGPEPTGHLAPSPLAFEVEGPGAGGPVLLLDDTWVTGARARSAAGALERAGVPVAGIVVVGRAVDPGAGGLRAAWWARCAATAGAPGRCVVPGCRRELPEG